MADKRPDPEALLARVQEEERQQSSGKLKIFLGSAPGVGKTYAMLETARAKRAEDLDVVVGIVETHGRKETEALVNNLEILPRLKVDYRGKPLEEFNLDAALARRPALILVDEAAHTNVPGSRHTKRWQDIKELLDRGIDVYTTLNVQHVESLNDIIAQITGVVVRETIPDSLIEQADTVELIDLPPDDLLKRLHDGKVYVSEQAKLATQNFFRESNLTALRELALRVTAERVNAEVLSHRRDQSVEETWPTAERLLVCIGPGLGSTKVVRAARRMSARLQAEWIAVFVESTVRTLSEEQRQSAMQNLRLAEQLGAETLTASGSDLVEEIITLARARNVTKIVMGKQIRPWWKDRLFGSLVDELVRRSDEIDIYIIRGDGEEKSHTSLTPIHTFTPTSKWPNYALSVVSVALCSMISFVLQHTIDRSNLIMVYLLGVVFIAARAGRGPSIVTALLSVLLFDFFFMPPPYAFALEDNRSFLNFAVMVLVGLVISRLTYLTRKQAEMARVRERRTAALHALSKQLATHRGIDKLLEIAARHISEVFDSQVLVLLPDEHGRLVVRGGHRHDFNLDPKEQSVAQWVYDLGQMAGLGTQTLPFVDAVYLPLRGSVGPVGALRVKPADPDRLLIPDQLRLLEAFANQTALAIEVDRLQEESKKAQK